MKNDEFYEIIAIRFKDKILFGHDAITTAKAVANYTQLISRAEFRFMSQLDLGDKWRQYAEDAPTLFVFPEDLPFVERYGNLR